MRHIHAIGLALGLMFGATTAQANCQMPANAQGFVNDMASQLNAQRRANGLRPLRYSQDLSRAATTHACDMQRRQFFAHKGSDGTNVFDRVKRTGAEVCRAAENIAFGYPTAGIVVDGWMNSPGHRRNILHNDVSDFGVGVAYAPGGPYAVMVFARGC